MVIENVEYVSAFSLMSDKRSRMIGAAAAIAIALWLSYGVWFHPSFDWKSERGATSVGTSKVDPVAPQPTTSATPMPQENQPTVHTEKGQTSDEVKNVAREDPAPKDDRRPPNDSPDMEQTAEPESPGVDNTDQHEGIQAYPFAFVSDQVALDAVSKCDGIIAYVERDVLSFTCRLRVDLRDA